MSTSLSDFGIRQTPPPGAGFKQIKSGNNDPDGYVDRLKLRYVWYPMADISLASVTGIQPMSVAYIHRGRIALIQPIPYRTVDNSHEAYEARGDGELPLAQRMMTPYAQCQYLHGNFVTRGLAVFQHLKDVSPKTVADIESVVLPVVPSTLVELVDYLVNKSPENIRNSGFDKDTLKLAEATLNDMRDSVNVAITYCRNLINESENEILTRRNKGVGKGTLDNNDRYAYIMLGREIPAEESLSSNPTQKTNDLLERFVIAAEKSAGRGGVISSIDSAETVSKAEFDELKSKLDKMSKQLSLGQKPANIKERLETS